MRAVWSHGRGLTVLSSTAVGMVLVVIAAAATSLVVQPSPAAAAARPTITYLSPHNGSVYGQERVTISGTGFVKGARVDFGRYYGTGVVVKNSTTLSVDTPRHTAGRVYVRVHVGGGTSAITTRTYFTFGQLPSLRVAPAQVVARAGRGPVQLTDLSCVSDTFCAVSGTGGWVNTYDGTTWGTAVRVAPSTVTVRGVSCTSATSCAAVADNGAVTFYDGTTWSAPRTMDTRGRPTAIDCFSATGCQIVDAAGYSLRTVTPTSWHLPVRVAGVGLTDVSCPSSTFCTTAGNSGYVVQYRSGWRAATRPDTTMRSPYIAVSCTSTTYCRLSAGEAGQREQIDGRWGRLIEPRLVAAFDVSCTSAHFCLLEGAGDSGTATFAADGAIRGRTDVRQALRDYGGKGTVSCWRQGRCLVAGQTPDHTTLSVELG